MAVQPKTKTEELVAELNAMRKAKAFNDFSLKKLEREAQKLINVDAAGAYLILGILSCIKREFDVMRSHHENAIKLVNDAECNRNYAASLLIAGFPSEAYDYYTAAAKLDVSNLGHAIQFSIASGRFSDAKSFMQQFHAVHPGTEHPFQELVMSLVEKMEENCVPADLVIQAVEIASSILREHGQFVFEPKIRVTKHPIRFEFPVCLTPDEVAELNFEFAERFVSHTDNTYSDTILFGFYVEKSNV